MPAGRFPPGGRGANYLRETPLSGTVRSSLPIGRQGLGRERRRGRSATGGVARDEPSPGTLVSGVTCGTSDT